MEIYRETKFWKVMWFMIIFLLSPLLVLVFTDWCLYCISRRAKLTTPVWRSLHHGMILYCNFIMCLLFLAWIRKWCISAISVWIISHICYSTDLSQRTFKTSDFYRLRQDHLTPAGLGFYQTDYDYSVKTVFHEILGMKEPKYEYDFPEQHVAEPKWFPNKVAFNV